MRMTHRLKCFLLVITLLALFIFMAYTKGYNIFKTSRTIPVNKLMKFVPVIVINRNVSKMFTFKIGDDNEYFTPSSYKLKNWHNYTLINEEKQRDGIGEQGKPTLLPVVDILTNIRMMYKYRVNAAVSDVIALNRSLPDVRHPKCKKKLYLESLPTVSVIIAFYNEYFTTLLRTVYSIVNRSPEHLVEEILLVDDGSTEEYDYLKDKLDNYVNEYLPKVKVVRLSSRSGVVGARLAGAKLATADVLVFLDSHIEVNVNWLPPLLEPIAMNCKTVVTPLIDQIDRQTFEYQQGDGGARGGLDWLMNYVRNPMYPKDFYNLPEPFETPLMRGIFAISRHYFWELGGYDSGLEIWGGENCDLSFKIWMCGGRLLEVPCSRVGHIVRDIKSIYESHKDNITRNYRRVNDIWNEFAERIYDVAKIYPLQPEYKKFDAGDLTEQKAFRKKCKPFIWYLNELVPEIVQNNNLMHPKEIIAKGRIRPLGKDKLCIDDGQHDKLPHLMLTRCSNSPKQIYEFSIFNEIRVEKNKIPSCWDVPHPWNEKQVLLYCCDQVTPSREWRYHEDLKLIVHMMSGLCLDHDAWSLDVFVNRCDENSETQRWVIDNSEVTLYSYNWELELQPQTN